MNEATKTHWPPGKRRTLFLGSVMDGLASRRKELTKLLLNNFDVHGMEQFPSGTDRIVQQCFIEMERCDAYVMLLSDRYGTYAEDTAYSYTEHEYEYAMRTGMPVIAFYAPLDSTWLEAHGAPNRSEALQADRFRKVVRLERTVDKKQYLAVSRLAEKILEACAQPNFFDRRPPHMSAISATKLAQAVKRTEREHRTEIPQRIAMAHVDGLREAVNGYRQLLDGSVGTDAGTRPHLNVLSIYRALKTDGIQVQFANIVVVNPTDAPDQIFTRRVDAAFGVAPDLVILLVGDDQAWPDADRLAGLSRIAHGYAIPGATATPPYIAVHASEWQDGRFVDRVLGGALVALFGQVEVAA